MVQEHEESAENQQEMQRQPQLKAVSPTAESEGAAGDAQIHKFPPYLDNEGGLSWIKQSNQTVELVHLTNFTARIVEDRVQDDGVDEQRTFLIEANLHGQIRRVSVPASQFASMSWVPEHLGANAVIFPGYGKKEHTRAAIHYFSDRVPERRVYAHLGWRKVNGQRVYLHADGAIGPEGPVTGIEVGLSHSLTRYQLSLPAPEVEQREAIRASLRLLELAPEHITFPLHAAIWRAVLPTQVDFGLWLAGPSGAGKSELAALLQQHFGAGFDARHLPAGWASSANALEALAFHAKDALLVVDDFAPSGTSSDILKLHQTAERLFRGVGNNTGRQRLNANTSLKGDKPPRALVLSTGEDLAKGQSLRARMLVLELGPNDLRWDALTACQQEAAQGLYAQAMAGFLQFLAKWSESLEQDVRMLAEDWRQSAANKTSHRRTPGIVAHLMTGFQWFLQYAQAMGAIDEEEVLSLTERSWAALGEAAAKQESHQAASEPVSRYLALLRSALASGRANVATRDGLAPDNAGAWGWQPGSNKDSSGLGQGREWHAKGPRIGWVDGEDLFLDPEPAFAAVQTLGRDTGEPLTITQAVLSQRLLEKNLLLSTERESRKTLLVRRSIEGRRRPVLHLSVSVLSAEVEDADDEDDVADEGV